MRLKTTHDTTRRDTTQHHTTQPPLSCCLAPETVISVSVKFVMLSSFHTFQCGALAATTLRGLKITTQRINFICFLYGSLALSVQRERINICTCEKVVKGGPRKPHSEEFHNLYPPIATIRFVAIQHACKRREMVGKRIVTGRPEGKSLHGRSRRRWLSANVELTHIK